MAHARPDEQAPWLPYGSGMADMFSEQCGDLLTGSYDCVDRIVLNAYFSVGHSAGWFRVWWRRWHGDTMSSWTTRTLMRLAGRFARRVRASVHAHGIAVIDCKAEDREHQIAEDYLAERPLGPGVFLVLVARRRRRCGSAAGVIHHLEKTRQFVNHYSFHIMDPAWGHVTIKISGHPPFGAQVILNGHEYVACTGRKPASASRRRGTASLGSANPSAWRRSQTPSPDPGR